MKWLDLLSSALAKSPLLTRLASTSLELLVLTAVLAALLRCWRPSSPRLVALLWLTVLAKPAVSLAVGAPIAIVRLELPAEDPRRTVPTVAFRHQPVVPESPQTGGGRVIVALATLIAVSLAQQEDWPKPDKKLSYGPLTIEVYVSRTAHLFHVIDQISAWDNACHGQYRSHMQLSSEDEDALRKYAEVRSKRRWGQGLEQTFYVPLELEEAARAGKKDGHVTHEELEVILPVLERFAPRVDLLFEDKQTALSGAFDAVDREWLTSAAKEVARFTGVSKLTVPAFPLASPEQGGGGMDGGRLRWEIGPVGMEQSVLLHELVHAFFMQKDELLQATVELTPGLTMTYLGEGFAYAFSPGLYGPKDRDVLGGNVASDRRNGQAWQDPNYGRQREYALALRPLLADALANGQTLEAFLPSARDAWLALREVEEARSAPTLFYTGPAGKVVHEPADRRTLPVFDVRLQQPRGALEGEAPARPRRRPLRRDAGERS